MKELTSLFLSQSYKDTWDDYARSLVKDDFAMWDYIILTASDEHQASGFCEQINFRKEGGFLPKKTKFAVIPDPGNIRVGSGGATLGVLRYLVNDLGSSDFSGKRILVIHSGGDSKRVPQYSALGKLFSPVPHTLPDGRPSTLFDEFIITMSSVPSRISEGMLLLSGDVLLLFNPLQIDFSGHGAAAISFKEKVETGKNHGVFLIGDGGKVEKFLHKQSVESLKNQGAVNENGYVDIDTGAIIFSKEVLEALLSLISENGKITDRAFDRLVNDEVRLSLYGDFLYPLANASDEEDFMTQAPEGKMCDALLDARREVYKKLSPFSLKLLRLAPAKFIHLGTTREIMKLLTEDIDDYRDLYWKSQNLSSVPDGTAGYNAIADPTVKVGKGSYLECSCLCGNSELGENSLLSFIEVKDAKIPADVVMHGLKTADGKFQVRIYGTGDNPKSALGDGMTLFGKDFSELLKTSKLTPESIWTNTSHTLWDAKLYPICDSISDGVSAALSLYSAVMSGDISDYINRGGLKSLSYGFRNADSLAVIEWNARMRDLVIMEKLYSAILSGIPAEKLKQSIGTKLSKIQEKWLCEKLNKADVFMKMRLNYYIGTALGGSEEEKYKSAFFSLIKDAINSGSETKFNNDCTITMPQHEVKLPLRVNFGGGWSDTPPYCNENGGTVLNAAILLGGEKPVMVKLTKINEKKIIFESRDMGTYGEFTSLTDLQRTGDPYDPYALQKAALVATGIIPEKGGNFDEILDRFGGGFIMQSEVTGVPKGSGLGTSSILAGASAKALTEFMGIKMTMQELYDCVLRMEQIMSTGGGWQDQVGGMETGLKLISSSAGAHQNLTVTPVDLDDKTKAELDKRFCLIYTGQRRLARNLLRDVIGSYIGNDENSLSALDEIQRIAVLMQFELKRGNVDNFAQLLNKHWELSKTIDAGSTNTLIDSIFDSVEDLISGKMICGAGGGGFLQVILKNGVTKEQLRARLHEVFQDNGVDLWDCAFV